MIGVDDNRKTWSKVILRFEIGLFFHPVKAWRCYADYFENSIKATRAHKLFCLALRERLPIADHLFAIPPLFSLIGQTLILCAPEDEDRSTAG